MKEKNAYGIIQKKRDVESINLEFVFIEPKYRGNKCGSLLIDTFIKDFKDKKSIISIQYNKNDERLDNFYKKIIDNRMTIERKDI